MTPLKSFRQFTDESYSLPRALGNGLHGNLRYGGRTFNPGLPASSPKKAGKPIKPLTDFQIQLLQTIKTKQGNTGVSVSSLISMDSGPSRATVKNALDALLLRNEIYKRTHKEAGSEVTKYFVNSEN